jgi:endoglucanase
MRRAVAIICFLLVAVPSAASASTLVSGSGGAPLNAPPVVNAGPNQSIQLSATASLTGSVFDDGLPFGAVVTSRWSKISGPGTVTFGNIHAPATTARFSSAGSYVLRLRASDGFLSSSASLTVLVASQPTIPPIGINMSEAEYSWGSFPGATDLAYIKSKNIRLIRLPVAWERLQTSVYGALDATYVTALKQFIAACGAQGMQVIVDVHNYGRYNQHWAEDAAANYGYVAVGDGDAIGSAALPIGAFADLWMKLAAALKATPGLGYYDIMNEPHTMGSAALWPAAAQAAVTAIRTVDMNTSILVAGTQWSSAYYWPWDNGNLDIVKDPAGKLLFEAHLYFDRTGGGQYSESYDAQGAYPNIGVDNVQPFLEWLKQKNVKGFIGEFGVPGTDPRWLTVLDNFLTAVKAAGLSGTYWNYTFHSPTDPSWWPVNEPMSIRLDNGQANPQIGILQKHNQF